MAVELLLRVFAALVVNLRPCGVPMVEAHFHDTGAEYHGPAEEGRMCLANGGQTTEDLDLRA